MRFTFENVSYLIEFERTSKERPSFTGQTKTSVVTTAKLYKVTGPAKTDREVVRTGTAAHYWKDRFSYESGRKAALAKALFDAQTVNGGEPLIGTRLSKAFKTAVWAAYHGRTK